MYPCGNKCGQDNKMSYKELKTHYETDCKMMKIECINCRDQCIRKSFKKHYDKTCVKNLIE